MRQKDIRERTKEFYQQNPGGNHKQLVEFLGCKDNTRNRRIIVQVQSELRGFTPGERQNHNSGRIPGTTRGPLYATRPQD